MNINLETFRRIANEHEWKLLHSRVVFLCVKLATRRLEFRLQAAPLANRHVHSAGRLKPELRTMFISASQITPSVLGNLQPDCCNSFLA